MPEAVNPRIAAAQVRDRPQGISRSAELPCNDIVEVRAFS
jgi:hypothetical protein